MKDVARIVIEIENKPDNRFSLFHQIIGFDNNIEVLGALERFKALYIKTFDDKDTKIGEFKIPAGDNEVN